MSPVPPTPGLAQLLELMQAGDLRALDVLARSYGPRLLAVARGRCHRAADAEDAVQQALLAASTAMTGYRGEGSPLAWLSTLVARSCHRMNRRAQVASESGDAPCSCDDPQARAEQRELGARLEEALMSLSRTDRLAFLLAAEGFSSVEIAERFGLTHDAIRSRLKRARKSLRARLLADDTPEPASGTPPANPNAGAPDDSRDEDPRSPRHAHHR